MQALRFIITLVLILGLLLLFIEGIDFFTGNQETVLVVLESLPLILILGISLNFFHSYFTLRKYEYKDVSTEQRPYPKPDGIYTELITLGFERLGEFEIKAPRHRPITGWVLINPEGTIYAELRLLGVRRPSNEFLRFSSTFVTDKIVETTFPSGINIHTPSFRSIRNNESVEAAYDDHQRETTEFARQYGRPNPLMTINDVIAWSNFYLQSGYGHRKIRIQLIIFTIATSFTLYGLASNLL
jgi:hypothetical protein